MSNLVLEGEDLRRAVKCISEMRVAEPCALLSDLVQKASLKFDLSPKDESFLLSFFIEDKDKRGIEQE